MNEKSIPILRILSKNWLFIFLLTVLCLFIGMFYSMSYVPPTYTATRSLILRTEIHDAEYNSQSANQANLAKNYFTTVEKLIKSPKLIKEVNENNREKGIVIISGAITMRYSDNSLIFKVSYTDSTKALAEIKLNALIETFSTSGTIKQGVMADDVQFIHTQKESDVVENNSHAKFILLGAAIGFVISVAISFIFYVFDTTIKDRQEFEELTGISVIRKNPKKKVWPTY